MSLRTMNPGTVALLLRRAESKSSDNPPAAASRLIAPELVSAYVTTGGVVVLQEARVDGTPGVAVHIPPDEWDEKWMEWFTRIIARKQRRAHMRLVR